MVSVCYVVATAVSPRTVLTRARHKESNSPALCRRRDGRRKGALSVVCAAWRAIGVACVGCGEGEGLGERERCPSRSYSLRLRSCAVISLRPSRFHQPLITSVHWSKRRVCGHGHGAIGFGTAGARTSVGSELGARARGRSSGSGPRLSGSCCLVFRSTAQATQLHCGSHRAQ